MANKFQVKRTTVTGRTPNTTSSGNTHFIDTGELALNLTDGKMFSSNGTVYFEVGANVVNQNVTGNATIKAIIANGTIGTVGQVLKSDGSIIYWDSSSGSGTVTQVSTGDGLAGGPITTAGTISVIANNGIIANSTGLFANAGTGLVVNATGIHVNSSYIGTLSSNNASNLGGVAAASYVQNTDSRTLSGNLVISGTYFNPSANTVLLGNSTQRWVISANTGSFSGAVSGITTLAAGNTTLTGFANVSTSVNSASLTVGTSFIANTSGAYHTGTVNAASFTTTGLLANTTAIVPTSNTILLGNSIGRFVLSANTGSFSGAVSGITTLAAGNTTLTGFANVTTSIQGGSSLTIAGAASGITTLAAGNTTITGFANVTSTIQGGSSLTIAGAASGITTLAAGNTTITGTIAAGNTTVTGFVNATSTIQGGSSLTIAGAASGITTLAAGNTTVTGFVNATSTIQGGSSLTIAGAASGITTLAAGNTTVTGFVNATSTIQGGSSLTIAGAASGITTLAAGNTTITGFADVSTSVNSAVLSVGSNFIANTTQITIAAGVSLSANGGVGTAGQVLHSNGATGSPYWALDDLTSVADDTTTNGNRYVLFANQTSSTLTTSYVSSTKMYFNPSTGKLNATSFNSLSDVFSKENIKTLDNAISKILMMRGVSFTWKGTEDKSIGLIAQEVEKVIPEVVSTSEDGIKSVSYDSIIGLLVEGIKEQQQTIEQMKISINILLDKINTEGDSK